MLLRCHHKIMCFIFVVDDVLEIDAGGAIELAKEFLIEYKSHAGYFLDTGFRFGVAIDEIGRDGDGKAPTKFFTFEPCINTCQDGKKKYVCQNLAPALCSQGRTKQSEGSGYYLPMYCASHQHQ
jgi:hypothetical protein